jgi:hypothetical protein
VITRSISGQHTATHATDADHDADHDALRGGGPQLPPATAEIDEQCSR